MCDKNRVMDFSACVHDVNCTRKNNIDRGCGRGQEVNEYRIFSGAHQLKHAITDLLYHQSV